MFPTRTLGQDGPAISAIGLGCMTMSDFYDSDRDRTRSFATIRRALDLGINFLDTADVYGQGHNETLVGKAIRGRRHDVFLATKCGIVRDAKGKFIGVNGRPEYIHECCNASLKRLGVEVIDLYYQHRVDPDVPIEETAGALGQLVEEGKVRHIGLSEAAADTIRRAHQEFPVSAVQSEYSLWTRDPERENLPTCRELGIAFVAYSPLGRGFLTGSITKPEDLERTDWRRLHPRFQPGNFEKNLDLVAHIRALAEDKGATPAQVAIAWLLHQGPEVIPIPGTKRVNYLEQNAEAAQLTLTEEELRKINEVIPLDAAAGTRYGEAGMKAVNL